MSASTIIHKWENFHAQVFSDFILELNTNNVKYFILRNFEGLPQFNLSKDIDIIIKPGSYKKALKLLIKTFKAHNLVYTYDMHFERAHCWFAMDVERDFFIHIDLIEGYANKGFEIIDFSTLYSNTIEYKNFRVLNSEFDALMLILYKLIGCKELKPKYQEKILSIYQQTPQKITTLLTRYLGIRLSKRITTNIECNDFYSLISLSKEIASTAKRYSFSKRPITTIFNIFLFLIEKFYRIVICPPKFKKFLAVEAPDGTGKTTFIEQLQIKIAETFVCELNKSQISHFRPEILPNLGAVGEKAKVMKQDKDFTNPHRAKPVGKISSFIRMTYYWLDYVIGMPLILRKNAQYDKFTIFDRYIYDFLVDPRRSRINLPYWLRKGFTKLVKQPKIVFVLDAPTEVIYKRKQELTPEEISRQLVEFRKLSSLGKRYYRLDASKKPEEIANDAIKIILEKFTNKL